MPHTLLAADGRPCQATPRSELAESFLLRDSACKVCRTCSRVAQKSAALSVWHSRPNINVGVAIIGGRNRSLRMATVYRRFLVQGNPNTDGHKTNERISWVDPRKRDSSFPEGCRATHSCSTNASHASRRQCAQTANGTICSPVAIRRFWDALEKSVHVVPAAWNENELLEP